MTWPAADPLPPAAAVPLLDGTRSAAYAFQVVAAQTGGDQRAVAVGTHTDLDSRAGPSSPGWPGRPRRRGPLGYALPYPVTAPDVASRLAGQVLTTLVAGGLAPLATLPEGSTAHDDPGPAPRRRSAARPHLGSRAGAVPRPGLPVTELVPEGFRARVAAYPPDEVDPTAWYAVSGSGVAAAASRACSPT